MPLARLLLWLGALPGWGLLAFSIAEAPPAPGPALGFFLGYSLLVTWGVMRPRAQMLATVVSSVRTAEERIALTFDDGPDPQTTPEILRLLAESGQRATFFVVGYKARRYPELLRTIRAQGHALGLHGYYHEWLFSLRSAGYVRADITATQNAIEAAVNLRPLLFRPPLGFVGPGTALASKQSRVTLVGWSSRGFDGVPWTRPEHVARRILGSLRPGAVVLLHDAPERGGRTPAALQALPRILAALKLRGLNSVPVPELFCDSEAQP